MHSCLVFITASNGNGNRNGVRCARVVPVHDSIVEIISQIEKPQHFVTSQSGHVVSFQSELHTYY